MIPNEAKKQIGVELKRLGREDPERLAQILKAMSPQEREALLFDWSVWARDIQLIRDYAEGWPETIIVFNGGRGTGKGLSLDTPILSTGGWTDMGSLKDFDYVCDHIGRPTMVTSHDPYMPERMYRIHFSGGETIEADGDHLWTVSRWASNSKDWWRRADTLSTDELYLGGNWFIPDASGDNWQIEKVVTIEPKLVRCITVDSESALYLAGRACIPTHNTRMAAEWVRSKLCSKPTNMAIMGPTSADTRDIMVSGPSGILACHPQSKMPSYEPSYARVVWPNGSVAKMYSGEKGDRVRGGNNELLWIDEVGAIEDKDAFDQAMFSLRIGESRALLTTTPRKGNKILLDLWPRAVFNFDPPEEGKDVRILMSSTYENLDNLSKTFRTQVMKAYEGTRLGQQELEGKMLFDSEAALWNTELIEKQRRDSAPEITMYAIGVDPAVTKKKGSDLTGIVGAGVGEDGFGYVLDDMTGKYGTSAWANRVKSLYDQYSEKGPTVIVVERNNGGDALVATLHQVDKNLPVKTVFSTVDKISRATPIAMLYEQARIMHRGVFADLENEMCSYDGTGKSPDRMDAMVFALTELMLKKKYKTTVRSLEL